MPDGSTAASTESGPGRAGSSVRLAVGLAVVTAVVVAVKLLPVDRWLLDFVAWVRSAGALGIVVFITAYVLASVLFLPGSSAGSRFGARR